jgi:hypothetical protein
MFFVNQRRETRYGSNQRVWATIYGKPDVRVPALIRNASGRGVGLEVERPIEPGAALKIEVEDGFLLGEAIYCRAEGPAFYVGVELEQALYGLVELGEIVRGFAGEPSGAEQEYAVHYADGQNDQQPG